MLFFSSTRVFLLGIIGALFLFCGCGARESRLIELVPSSSNMVIDIDWAAIRKDEGLKQIANSQMYETQLRRLGIDSAKVNQVMVFGMINLNMQGALLIQGSFGARKTAANLTSQGWSEESLDGKKIYVNGKDVLAAVTDRILAGGTREGVAAVFRAQKNSRESLAASASFKKIKNAMSKGREPIEAYLLAPEGSAEVIDAALSVAGDAMSLFDLGGVGAILKRLNVASGIGFTIARGRDRYCAVNFSVLMRDEKTALIAADSLNFLKTLSTSVTSGMKDAQTSDAMRDFKVTREENILLLRMQMPDKAFLSPEV